MFVQKKRRVVADEELNLDTNVDEIAEEPAEVEDESVDVDPAATDLLFETEDVAELLAEVTSMPVEVTVDDESSFVVFGVGDDEFRVEPDGDEEVLETSRKVLKKKTPVKASARAKKNTKVAPKRGVKIKR